MATLVFLNFLNEPYFTLLALKNLNYIYLSTAPQTYSWRSSQEFISQNWLNTSSLCFSLKDWQSLNFDFWQNADVQAGPITLTCPSLSFVFLYVLPLSCLFFMICCFHSCGVWYLWHLQCFWPPLSSIASASDPWLSVSGSGWADSGWSAFCLTQSGSSDLVGSQTLNSQLHHLKLYPVNFLWHFVLETTLGISPGDTATLENNLMWSMINMQILVIQHITATNNNRIKL